MRDALTANTFGVWVGQKTRKSAFGGKANKPGLKAEHEEALLDDQARTDYLEQKAKDDAKAAAESGEAYEKSLDETGTPNEGEAYPPEN